jgi:peptidylprolyl isomerase
LALALALTACSDDAPGGDDSASAPVEASASPAATPTAEDQPSVEPSADDAGDEASVEPTEESTPPIPESTDLSAITVTGEPGTKPVVTVPAPWAINRSQNRVLNPGDGALVLPGDIVRIDYLGVNGRTGEVFDNSYDTGAPAVFPLSGVVAGFAKGLTGQRVGSRVLMAMPSADGYGDTGSGDAIQGGDSLIFVAEIKAVSRQSVSGTVAAIPDGLPLVTGDLKPQVTLPADARRQDTLQVVTLIEGDGPEAGSYAQLQVNYVEYAWTADNLTQVRQTYGTGAGPVYATLTTPTVNAWLEGLAQVKEGSRVLIVAPPDQAYPSGNSALGVPRGAYSVWVVDVLFVA